MNILEFIKYKKHTVTEKYNALSLKAIKQLSGEKICYVTLNKTHNSLKELFIKNKIDIENIIFIDAISKTIKKVSKEENEVYFCNSPGALTEISLIVTKLLKYVDYLVFDSLTNLSTYQKSDTVVRFMTSLINKIKSSKTKTVFYALDVKEQEGLVRQISMFTDKIIRLDKT